MLCIIDAHSVEQVSNLKALCSIAHGYQYSYYSASFKTRTSASSLIDSYTSPKCMQHLRDIGKHSELNNISMNVIKCT